MPHFPSPADELRHLEEKQFTVGLTDEEQARLAALSEPAPAGGGFDVAAAAAGVLADTAPAAGPWSAADYGWDPSDPNAVAWAAYYSELGWDPAAVQAHLAAEAAASAGEAQPEVETAELAPGEPAPPLDDVAAPLDDLALPSGEADAVAAAAWDAGEPTAALESLGSPIAESLGAPMAESLGAPLAEAAVEPAPAPAEEPAMPALELVEPEPEAEAAAAVPSAWDAPAPEASYAPEGEDVLAPVATAGGTQVWDLSAVQAALAAGSQPAVEAAASAVELLPTFDAEPAAAAASDEPPDFRHDVPPGWPGEPEAALKADFELAGSGSFDPASTAALPGMDAVPPAFPDLAPVPEARPEPPLAAAAPESTDVALDDFDIELEGDDLEPAAEHPQVEHAPADPTDRLAALDLSAPFLGEPEPELEPAGGVDWAAAHAVPAGDSAVDLATFEAEPGDESGGGAPAPDGDEGGGDATRLWALSEPALAAPPVRLSPVLPALEDEPEPFVAAAPVPLQAIEPEPLPVIEAEPEPAPEAVELASAADFLAAAAAAGAPAHATPAPEAEIEPDILEVGDDVLEVVGDEPPAAVPAAEALEAIAPDRAEEPAAAVHPAPAPPLGLEALFGADEIHDAPAFPDVAAAPAPAVPYGGSAPEPPPAAIALGPTDAAPLAAAREPGPLPVATLEPAGSDAGPADPFGLEAAIEEPPPEPAAAPAAFVPGAHRVVVHTADGQVKRGTLSDVALDAPEVLLAPQSGGQPEALSAERIRAIFFMLPTGEAPPQPEGKRVRVTFRDGRQVAGYSPDYDPQRVGFFMIPADSRTHTARIWVYRASVRQVSVT